MRVPRGIHTTLLVQVYIEVSISWKFNMRNLRIMLRLKHKQFFKVLYLFMYGMIFTLHTSLQQQALMSVLCTSHPIWHRQSHTGKTIVITYGIVTQVKLVLHCKP